MIEPKEIKNLLAELTRERFGDKGPPNLRFDLVNLDRDGKGGLVYLDGMIVRRGNEILDGFHRLAAIKETEVAVEMRIAQINEGVADPIPGAIYVPAGATPQYVIDRETRTVLLAHHRGDREATLSELRTATMAALAEMFAN